MPLVLLKTNKPEISFVATPGNGIRQRGFAVWDETHTEPIGVYPTFLAAKAALKEYCEEWLDIYEPCLETLTCFQCPARDVCPFVDDPYNTDGDCLMDK